MQILVNGDPREIPDGLTLDRLVEDLGLAGKRIAIEVNAELVPRTAFPAHALTPGDRVEIIQAVGGG